MELKIAAFIIGFAGMEFVAWFMHKYVMHGILWFLHKSHHQKGKGFFELNDLYFLLFASPAIALIITGAQNGFTASFFLGIGIAAYGFTYLVVHDVIIHQRARFFVKTDNPYIRALRKAHKAHHAKPGKDADASFGMLWVNRKYYDRDMAVKLRGHNIIF